MAHMSLTHHSPFGAGHGGTNLGKNRTGLKSCSGSALELRHAGEEAAPIDAADQRVDQVFRVGPETEHIEFFGIDPGDVVGRAIRIGRTPTTPRASQ